MCSRDIEVVTEGQNRWPKLASPSFFGPTLVSVEYRRTHTIAFLVSYYHLTIRMTLLVRVLCRPLYESSDNNPMEVLDYG